MAAILAVNLTSSQALAAGEKMKGEKATQDNGNSKGKAHESKPADLENNQAQGRSSSNNEDNNKSVRNDSQKKAPDPASQSSSGSAPSPDQSQVRQIQKPTSQDKGSESQTQPQPQDPLEPPSSETHVNAGINDELQVAGSSLSQSVRRTLDISDSLKIDERGANSMTAANHMAPVSAASELKIVDNVAVRGFAALPTTAPRIFVTSPPVLQVSERQDAKLAFDSSTAGTYSIVIRDSMGNIVYSVDGQLVAGANSASWDGKE